MSNLTNDEVVSCVKMLKNSFGIKRAPNQLILEIEELFRQKEFSRIICKIKNFMCLEIGISACYIKGTPSHDSMAEIIARGYECIGLNFGHCQLVDISKRLLPQISNAMFTITLPNNTLFGTREFKKRKVVIFIFERVRKSPDVFTAGIAHELCHVILESTFHPLRKDEHAVDIAAMVLGFADSYKSMVEKSFQHTYLNPTQVFIAHNEITRILK